jgi:hypothetical protein
LTPLFKVECGPIERDFYIPSCIVCLLINRRPTAVVFAVAFIVIYSIQSMLSARFWPHISVKVYKRIDPFIANRDSPTGMVWVVGFCCIGTSTSSLHISPSSMLWGLIHPVGGAFFRMVAPATCGQALT